MGKETKTSSSLTGAASEKLFSLEEMLPSFSDLNDIEEVLWDHVYTGHSTNGHPLEPYRETMKESGLPDAETVNRAKDGRTVSYAGLVICRQLPETANGVLFITLEDETGFVNCIVWQKVFQQYRTIILSNTFLGVTGKVQADKGVLYLVLDTAWKPDLKIQRAPHQSHDFR
jgi:error-prone DNA polymerase